jgi:hypothetical protein
MGKTANHWDSATIGYPAINAAVVTRKERDIIEGFPKLSKNIFDV